MSKEISGHLEKAAKLAHDRPALALSIARSAAENLCLGIHREAIGQLPGVRRDLDSLVSTLSISGCLPPFILALLDVVRAKSRQRADALGGPTVESSVWEVLAALNKVLVWYTDFADAAAKSRAIGESLPVHSMKLSDGAISSLSNDPACRDDPSEVAARIAHDMMAAALGSRAPGGLARGVAATRPGNAPEARRPIVVPRASSSHLAPKLPGQLVAPDRGGSVGAPGPSRVDATQGRVDRAVLEAIRQRHLVSMNWAALEGPLTTTTERGDLAALYVARHDELIRVQNNIDAARFMLRAARIYESLGDLPRALAAAQTAFNEDIASVEVIHVLGRLAARVGQWAEVLRLCADRCAREPAGPRRSALEAQIARWRTLLAPRRS